MQNKRFFVNRVNTADINKNSLKIETFSSFDKAINTYKGDSPGIMSRTEQSAGLYNGSDIYFISGNVSLYTSFVS